MAGTKKKPGPVGEKGTAEETFSKKEMKKVFYGGQMLLVAGAFLILLIMLFVSWDFIDKTEKLVKGSADDACYTLAALETTLIDTEAELALFEDTLDGMNESFYPLAQGLENVGDALQGVSDSFSALKTFGVYVSDDLGNTADDMKDAADSLRSTVGSFGEHKEKFSQIKNDISLIRVGVSSQKETMCDKTEITEIFDSMRLTVIIIFILAAVLILILFFNSAAGIL